MMMPTIPNYVLKFKARAALKPVFPVVLMCALAAALPSLAAQTVAMLTGSDVATYLSTLASTEQELLLLLSSNENIFAALEGYFTTYMTTPRMLSGVLNLVNMLISPVLTLGLTHCLLQVLRGNQEIGVSMVFSRVKYFFHSLGQQILIVLKLLLWSLPGMALSIGGGVIAILTGLDFLMWLYIGGMILMMVLMIRAMLHYSMASTYLADDPTIGVRGSIKASVKLMRHRKMALFSLLISYYLWMMVLNFAANLLIGLFGTVIANTAYMVAQMILGVYMQAWMCTFYEAYRLLPSTPDPNP